jgi:stage V sporulation protein D (sporulation-specific penicillin-binding protein)
MTIVDLASSSFGQANKITPLQMITAYAAVVNGGNLVTPYVVDKIVDTDGNIVEQFEPQIKRQVISEETSQIMRETLETVVITNGGSNAYIQGYRIGGKSGTSQKIDEYGEAGKNIYVSSYVGFAPADDPEIIMLVMVDEPSNGKYYGSLVAAPVVSSVFKDALPYLGYFPEYTAEEYEDMAITIQEVTGENVSAAKTTLESAGLTVEVVGSGESVVKQVPSSGSTMPRNGKIILYTEQGANEELVTVPNVMNMSYEQAEAAITQAGLNFKPDGGAANHAGAYVSYQNYNGTLVPRATIIEVTLVINDETG